MAESMPALQFWDPHFHLWDISADSASGHDSAQLFAPAGDPVYTLSKYERDVADSGLELTGGVVVEAMSVCHLASSGRAFATACLAEADWVTSQVRSSERAYWVVAAAALEDPMVECLLDRLRQGPEICGIRQILNHDPSWPRNQRLGNLLDNPRWRHGYSLLASHGFAFDLQLNPHQFRQAAQFLSSRPEVPVIIDHLGSPTRGDLSEPAAYWEGMRALADLPQVNIKISMLSYTSDQWHQDALVKDTVAQVVDWFGVERCCFASNFPVEARSGWTAARLFTAYRALVTAYSTIDLQKLFGDNARRFYGESRK